MSIAARTMTSAPVAGSHIYSGLITFLVIVMLTLLTMFLSTNPVDAHERGLSSHETISKNSIVDVAQKVDHGAILDQCHLNAGTAHCNSGAFLMNRPQIKVWPLLRSLDYAAYANIPLDGTTLAPPTPPPIYPIS